MRELCKAAIETDDIGLIVLIIAIAIVLIAGKLQQCGKKKGPP